MPLIDSLTGSWWYWLDDDFKATISETDKKLFFYPRMEEYLKKMIKERITLKEENERSDLKSEQQTKETSIQIAINFEARKAS